MTTKIPPELVDDQVFGGRRLNINGDMRVAQRGTKTSMQNGFGGPDRIRLATNSLGVFTLSQSSSHPNNFMKSFHINTTTANGSPGADAYALLQYKFEGNDLSSLKWGTSDAEQVTVSFWVKTNKTGTYNLELYQLDNSSNPFANKQYTVSAADTWEKKVVTFPSANNVEIPLDDTNALNLNFWLGGGSNYTSGSASDGNFHSTTANRAAGNVNIADSTSNTFRITGLQIETGTQATPFEYRSIGEELAMCQRYYQLNTPNAGRSNSTTSVRFQVTGTTEMRTTPSLSLVDGTDKAEDYAIANRNITAVGSISGGTTLGGLSDVTTTSTTSGKVQALFGGAIALDAEL